MEKMWIVWLPFERVREEWEHFIGAEVLIKLLQVNPNLQNRKTGVRQVEQTPRMMVAFRPLALRPFSFLSSPHNFVRPTLEARRAGRENDVERRQDTVMLVSCEPQRAEA